MKIIRPPKYLTRLICTCLLLSLLPCVLLLGMTVVNSYGSMQTMNEEYYWEITDSFMRYADDELAAMRGMATRLSVDSKQNIGTNAALNFEIGSSNYYYWMAAKELPEYARTYGYNAALYLEESGELLYSTRKYNSFASFYADMNKGNKTVPPEVETFFDMDMAGIRFASIDNKLLVGVPSYVGSVKNSVLVVFILEGSWADAGNFAGAGAACSQFRIYNDDGGLMLTSGEELSIEEADFSIPERDGEVKRLSSGKNWYTVYMRSSPSQKLKFVTIVPFDNLEISMYRFYTTMKLTFALEILLVLLLGVCMVYINYLPVRRFSREVPGSGDGDEFGGAAEYIKDLHSDLSEQKILLMDYLMNNLIGGASVPEEILTRAHIEKTNNCCVMVLFDRSVNTVDRTALSKLLWEDFGVTAFVTDILGSNRMVILCLIKDNDISSAEHAVREWMTTHVAYPIELKVGPVVGMDAIHDSYTACLPVEANDEGSDVRILKLKNEVLAYIDDVYTDAGLSQVSIADRFGISTYSLSRLFKNHVGIGFSEYVSGKRLDMAKTLLLTTDLNVGEIAGQVGIPNANYFSRLFKTNTGVSPMQYRHSEKNEEDGIK